MKINLHSPIEEVQVQIIPLIDVIFCILTFFLLAALQFTRQQAINVDLPRANTGTPPQIRQTLIVTLDAIGQTYVEQEAVSRDQLTQRLQAYRLANPEGIMVLNASRSTSYNEVIQVLDLLRSVGGDRVALATLQGEDTQNVTPTVPVVPGVVPSAPNAPIPTIPPTPAPNLTPIPTPALPPLQPATP